MAILKDSYSETNEDTFHGLVDNHPSATGNSAGGQALTAGATFTLTSLKFYLKKTGSPTGTAYARLYASTGTVGTNAKPTGGVLASSAGFDVSTLTTNYALTTFDFSGDPYELQNGTDYCIAFEAQASGTCDGSNFAGMGLDGSSPSHGGSCFYYNNGWQDLAANDTCFYMYGTLPLNIKRQAIFLE